MILPAKNNTNDYSNGFVFMSPDNFDCMGPDLHACLKTFQLHPSTAAALPPRPAHLKSAMRLRKAPPMKPAPPNPPQQQQQQSSMFTFEENDGFARNRNGNKNERHRSATKGSTGAAGADDWCSSGINDDDDDNGGVCESAQHFSWFLLTSACLSKVSLIIAIRVCVILCSFFFGARGVAVIFCQQNPRILPEVPR